MWINGYDPVERQGSSLTKSEVKGRSFLMCFSAKTTFAVLLLGSTIAAPTEARAHWAGASVCRSLSIGQQK
jgi:hypothetical protein